MASKKRITVKCDIASVLLMLPLGLMLYRHIMRGETYDPTAILGAGIFFFFGIVVAIINADDLTE